MLDRLIAAAKLVEWADVKAGDPAITKRLYDEMALRRRDIVEGFYPPLPAARK